MCYPMAFAEGTMAWWRADDVGKTVHLRMAKNSKRNKVRWETKHSIQRHDLTDPFLPNGSPVLMFLSVSVSVTSRQAAFN